MADIPGSVLSPSEAVKNGHLDIVHAPAGHLLLLYHQITDGDRPQDVGYGVPHNLPPLPLGTGTREGAFRRILQTSKGLTLALQRGHHHLYVDVARGSSPEHTLPGGRGDFG